MPQHSGVQVFSDCAIGNSAFPCRLQDFFLIHSLLLFIVLSLGNVLIFAGPGARQRDNEPHMIVCGFCRRLASPPIQEVQAGANQANGMRIELKEASRRVLLSVLFTLSGARFGLRASAWERCA